MGTPGSSPLANLSYLMLESNSQCNLECRYCNRSDLEARGLRAPKRLTEQELRLVLDQVKDCPIDTIKFEGLSEPMLHPKFDELATVLRSYFPKAFVIIATNLQYNVERSALLRTLKYVDMVYLSIDGTRDVYEHIRTGAKWSMLESALDDLARLVPATTRRSKLFINFTATDENFRELPALYELRERYDLAGVRINLAQNWNEHETNSHAFGKELLEMLKRYRADVKGVAGWDYKDCFWPFNGVVIDVFGFVRQCVINTSMEPVGNVFERPLAEIYRDAPRLKETRRLLEANKPGPGCAGCDYKHLSPLLETILGGRHAVNAPRKKAR